MANESTQMVDESNMATDKLDLLELTDNQSNISMACKTESSKTSQMLLSTTLHLRFGVPGRPLVVLQRWIWLHLIPKTTHRTLWI